MSGGRRTGTSAVVFVALLCGCGSGLPSPRLVEHGAGEEPQVVPTMPPPGKVEIVTPRPNTMKHPVWIDGEWEWNSRRWLWKENGWHDEPPDKGYAPPITRRLPDGRILYLPGKKDEPVPP